jgi:hypothetical protein
MKPSTSYHARILIAALGISELCSFALSILDLIDGMEMNTKA